MGKNKKKQKSLEDPISEEVVALTDEINDAIGDVLDDGDTPIEEKVDVIQDKTEPIEIE